MTLPVDTDLAYRHYAHPERLVSADWLSSHLGMSGLVIIEVDDDSSLYDIGHIPGAIKINWSAELNDPYMRDYITPAQFGCLMDRKGVTRDDTVVIYGNQSNCWASYTLWLFTLFGHPDVRLLDGGRDLWISSYRDVVFDVPTRVTSGYTAISCDDAIRAYRHDVLEGLGQYPLVDVRPFAEYLGEDSQECSLSLARSARMGHIPGALSLPWEKSLTDDGLFHSYETLYDIYGFLCDQRSPIVYSHMGAHSSHTWFVLTYLLGIPDVRHYDGSWVEWGNAVRVPIVTGSEPGSV